MCQPWTSGCALVSSLYSSHSSNTLLSSGEHSTSICILHNMLSSGETIFSFRSIFNDKCTA